MDEARRRQTCSARWIGFIRCLTCRRVPASWAEWLYFKGQSGDVRFYLTFLAGPKQPEGRRVVGVRLQLDRGGRLTTYGASDTVSDEALIAGAPDLQVGRSRVRLEGMRYHVTLDLDGVSGDIFIEAVPGRSLAPLAIRGAGGWVSGYVVPVTSGALSGSLSVAGEPGAAGGARLPRSQLGILERRVLALGTGAARRAVVRVRPGVSTG